MPKDMISVPFARPACAPLMLPQPKALSVALAAPSFRTRKRGLFLFDRFSSVGCHPKPIAVYSLQYSCYSFLHRISDTTLSL
jgi:hypothetical protein